MTVGVIGRALTISGLICAVSIAPAAVEPYDSILESVLPSGFSDTIARGTDWTVTIRRTGSFPITKETWVKMEKPYAGEATATLRVPSQRSIFTQVEALMDAKASRSVAAAEIRIDECRMTSDKGDTLSKYASEIPPIRFAELSEGLLMDPIAYEVWFQANYGNRSYVRYLAGSNDLLEDKGTEVPSIRWAKQVMRLLLDQCKEFKRL